MENYQFIRQIGHGTYGDVWLVKCSKTRKKHILKRIDLHQIPKREQRAAYLEAKFLATLKHPNLVKYLDTFYNSSGSLYIVMGYCELGSLYEYMKCQNGIYLDEKLIVQWLVQICLALKYLHDKNILHRNLKTKNLFLARNENIKVGNIGVSKILSLSQEMSPSLVETPYYTSPESLSGSSLSQKSDVWALGCCMYELATLKHPYVSKDSQSLLQKIKKKLPPLPEFYSSELYHIITSMLNPVAEKRPSITELLLNDFIRKYILINLKNGFHSPSDRYSAKSSSLSSGRSKSSSDLTPRIHDHLNGYLHKSISTNLLSSSNPSKAKLSNSTLQPNSKAPNDSIITVPDVNGNADGNDNSQDGLEYLYPHSLSSWAETDSWDSSRKYSANSVNEQKKGSCPPFSSFETRVKVRQQKIRGEMSLQILHRLTHTLQSARNQKYAENYQCSDVEPPKCFQAKRKIASTDERKVADSLTYDYVQEREGNGAFTLPQITKAAY